MRFLIFILICSLGNCLSDSSENDNAENLLTALLQVNVGEKILLVGDSLTVRSQAFGLESAAQDTQWTIQANEGFSYREWNQRKEQLLTDSFDTVLFFLGTNDGYEYSSTEFSRQVSEVQSYIELKSTARIYHVLTYRSLDAGLRSVILNNNSWLSDFCASKQRTDCIDIDTPVHNAIESNTPPGLYGIDPIHPEPAGYSFIKSILIRNITNH